ncbi:MAG: SAM-dependent methyltransferase [Pseudomonadota bacterium]
MTDGALPKASGPLAWLPMLFPRLWRRSAGARINQQAPSALDLDEAAAKGAPAAGRPGAGFVSLVGAGPGSADLITLRGLERLQSAEVVFYDRLVDPALLNHAPRNAERVYVGKAPGAHAWTQDRINEALVSAATAGRHVVRLKCGDPGVFARGAEEAAAAAAVTPGTISQAIPAASRAAASAATAGRHVVRLKCGDPGVFARGAEEAAALDAAGMAWEIVPGVTAAAAAAAAAGSFLTARGETDTLVLTTGRLAECPALEHADNAPDWANFLHPGTTLAVYMGVATAGRLSARLLEQGLDATLPVEIVHAAGTPEEAVFHTQLGRLEDTVRVEGIRNPAMIMIRRPKGAQPGVGTLVRAGAEAAA